MELHMPPDVESGESMHSADTRQTGEPHDSNGEPSPEIIDGPRKEKRRRSGAETANGELQALLDEVQRAAGCGIMWISLPAGILHFTDDARRLFGFELSDGSPSLEQVFARIHPGDRQRTRQLIDEQIALRQGTAHDEFRVVLPDGTVRLVDNFCAILTDAAGEPVRIVCTVRDISESRAATRALVESELELQKTVDELEGIINALPGMVSVVDRQYTTLVANKAVIEKFGQSDPIDVIGKKCYTVRKKRDDVCPQCGIARAFATGNPFSRVSTPEEERLMGVASKAYAVPLRNAAGEIWGGVEVIMDVTDLREKERLLRENEERFRAIIEQAGDAVYLCDLEGRIVNVNNQAVISVGYGREELLRKTIMELDVKYATPESFGAAVGGVSAGDHLQIESRHRRRDGSTFPVEICISKIAIGGRPHVLGFVRDISERIEAMNARIKLEQQLNKHQKLESLGVLAGGIAHDFNNLLGGIFGYIEMALLENDPPAMKSNLGKCLAVIDRARGLTRQLLTFSKGGAPVKKIRPLFPFVRETVEFAVSGSGALPEFMVDEGLWLCEYDENQIGQVIDNMVINATQAMPMGGRITVAAENSVVTGEPARQIPPGRYVKLSISDTGVGIPPEILQNIFDPFFTTKQKGSGLGLSTCHSIVAKHGGSIEATSEPGRGTTFVIFLPASEKCPDAQPIASQKRHPGTGRILIMDDEKIILDVIESHCRAIGYAVLRSASGAEALQRLTEARATADPVKAVILDLTVAGGMGGRETIAALRKIDPDVPVFVASGYADDPVMADPVRFGFTGSICKPFTREELTDLLTRYLGLRSDGPACA